jgi:hypothetical protein
LAQLKKTDKVLLYGFISLLAAGGLCVACLVAVIFLPFSWFSHGGAAETARYFLKNDPVVQARIGDIRDFGWLPSGSVREVNGAGRAHLVFSLKGSRAEGRATVDLAKEAGKDWEVTAATLAVGGKEFVLKGDGTLTMPPAPVSPREPGPESGYPKDEDGGLAA